LRAGAGHKTPGIQGLSLEFYTANWDIIITDLTELLKGINICCPKPHDSYIPDDFLPVSLLKTEYKLLARILTRRLRPILADLLSTSQSCGVPGNSILEPLQAFVTY